MLLWSTCVDLDAWSSLVSHIELTSIAASHGDGGLDLEPPTDFL